MANKLLNLRNLALNRLEDNFQIPLDMFLVEGTDFATERRGSPYEVSLYDALEFAVKEGLIDIKSAVSFQFYDLGDNAYVFANGEGVTFAKNSTTGELLFSIPDNVLISGGGVLISTDDTDSNDDAFIQLNFAGTRLFNQSVQTAWKPIIDVSNGQALPSRGVPSYKSNIVQTALTGVGSNNIEVMIKDAGNLFSDILINFVLP